MTSRVVRFPPESYSRVMPSLAISAAFNCAEVAKRTLLDDTYLDQLFDVFVVVLFLASCNKSLARCSLKDDFLSEETFSPPLIIGQVIVAFMFHHLFHQLKN